MRYHELVLPAGQRERWFDQLPRMLQPNKTRWDGRLSMALIPMGLVLYEAVIRTVEPYYRWTGQFQPTLQRLASELETFLAEWDKSILCVGPPDEHYPGTAASPPDAAFEFYPCGVVDAVTGASSLANPWWERGYTVSQWPREGAFLVGTLSPTQSQAFRQQTGTSFRAVTKANGRDDFRRLSKGLRDLLTAPLAPPSAEVFDKFRELVIGSTVSATFEGSAKTFDMLVEATEYKGQGKRQSVTLVIPMGVQPNPGADDDNVTRRALSPVTFGYEVSISVGGEQSKVVFQAPLRLRPDDPGLYHTGDPGSQALRALPDVGTWQSFAASVPTYDTLENVAGTRRTSGNLQTSQIVFLWRVVLRSGDSPGSAAAAVAADGPNPRGVLYLEVWSSAPGNRSFTLTVSMVETVAINDAGVADGSHHKSYRAQDHGRLQATFSVPASVIILPDAFFDQNDSEREHFLDKLTEQWRNPPRIGRLGPEDFKKRLDRLGSHWREKLRQEVEVNPMVYPSLQAQVKKTLAKPRPVDLSRDREALMEAFTVVEGAVLAGKAR